jgi:hypothetical protein
MRLENLVTENEATISMLSPQDQGFTYIAKLNTEKKILKRKHEHNMKNRFEYMLMKTITQKIKGNLMVTCADKSKMVVTTDNSELHNKIMKFNIENGLKRLAKDPTPKHQKEVKDVIRNCTTIINKTSRYKCV